MWRAIFLLDIFYASGGKQKPGCQIQRETVTSRLHLIHVIRSLNTQQVLCLLCKSFAAVLPSKETILTLASHYVSKKFNDENGARISTSRTNVHCHDPVDLRFGHALWQHARVGVFSGGLLEGLEESAKPLQYHCPLCSEFCCDPDNL